MSFPPPMRNLILRTVFFANVDFLLTYMNLSQAINDDEKNVKLFPPPELPKLKHFKVCSNFTDLLRVKWFNPP